MADRIRDGVQLLAESGTAQGTRPGEILHGTSNIGGFGQLVICFPQNNSELWARHGGGMDEGKELSTHDVCIAGASEGNTGL